MMHLAMHLNIIIFMWKILLDPSTTCLRHLLPGSGTTGTLHLAVNMLAF
jgi:hypothetical protein